MRSAPAPGGGSRGTIVFDLDGTLVDSAPDLADALDELLRELGLAPLGLTTARKLIGHGMAHLVRAGLEARGIPAVQAQLETHAHRFREIYSINLSRKTRPYAGVEAGLSQLHQAGWRLGVCTNKLERYSRQILHDLGLIGYFGIVAGPDTFGIGKPDPGHLVQLIETLGGDRERALMVGDSDVDVSTAKAAHVCVIAVTYGYCKVPLASLKPDMIVEEFAAVLPAVAQLSKAWPARESMPQC